MKNNNKEKKNNSLRTTETFIANYFVGRPGGWYLREK